MLVTNVSSHLANQLSELRRVALLVVCEDDEASEAKLDWSQFIRAGAAGRVYVILDNVEVYSEDVIDLLAK